MHTSVHLKILAKRRHTENYTPTTSTHISHVDDPDPHLLRKITNMFTEVTSPLFPEWRELYKSIVKVLLSTWRNPS